MKVIARLSIVLGGGGGGGGGLACFGSVAPTLYTMSNNDVHNLYGKIRKQDTIQDSIHFQDCVQGN